MFRRLRLTAGLRYDYFDYTSFASLSPRAGLSLLLSPITTISFAYGRHYQSPYPVELVANEANTSLKNKYTDQYVVGIDHLFREDIKLTLEAYYKEYFDVPISQRYTTPDPFDYDDGVYVNASKGRASGIELFLQKKLTDNFSTIISYARSRSETFDPRFATYYASTYDYQNVFTAMGGYKFRFSGQSWYENISSKPWYHALAWLPIMPSDEYEISIKWRYLGGRPYTSPAYYPMLRRWIVEEEQVLNSNRYTPYHRLDLRIDRRFLFNNWTLLVFFDIVNIYNRDNIWNYQYNDDGSISTVLQYKTFPVGGVTLEF